MPARAAARTVLLAGWALLLPGAAPASSYSVSVDERQGLPSVSREGEAALSSRFAFWAKDWVWSAQRIEFRTLGPFDYAASAQNRALNLSLAARVRKTAQQTLVWQFDLDAAAASPDAVGGGISFRFNLERFGAELGEPELLGENRGWRWGRPGAGSIEMRFDPPLAAVYFERGQKREVRAFFYQGGVPQGRRSHTATLQLAGKMALEPTAAERFGPQDTSGWPTDIVDASASPVDLSFLNAGERPAGRRGFVRALGDRLVFEDGTPARFWGTNLTALALFGTRPENVKTHARRLSELGFNLVRVHHHDSFWVNPNIFGARQAPDTQSLSPQMLERLDWWIKCLIDEGIYVWLDLHVQRHFKPADRIDAFEEISRQGGAQKGGPLADLKGYNYVNPSIRQAMQRYNEALVNHRNAYTGRRYAEEPAIVAMLITNENDITHHFGNSLQRDRNVPWHNARYMAEVEAFARKHGLPAEQTSRSWAPGPGKLFLNDLEQRFNAQMIGHLRALGVKAPLVTTSTWGFNPLSSLPALTAGDLIDVHAYGGAAELERNPLHAAGFVHWLAAAQVAGKPLTVTEWNVSPFPVPDRHAAPLLVAAAASHQGWRAVMQYAYAQVPLNDGGTASNWHAFNDPALLATLPAAALLYRQEHVREARSVYVFAPAPAQLFHQAISPATSAALRTAAERGKLLIALPQTPELPWLAKSAIPPGAKVIDDPNRSLLEPGALEAASDSGEIRRRWSEGILTIDTPRTQAAAGWLGGKSVVLTDVEVAARGGSASVAVQSLDGNPIRSSRALLISLGARALPASAERPPFHAEPVEGRLAIRAPAGLRLYASVRAGTQQRPSAAAYDNGRYLIALDRGLGTYWLVLK